MITAVRLSDYATRRLREDGKVELLSPREMGKNMVDTESIDLSDAFQRGWL